MSILGPMKQKISFEMAQKSFADRFLTRMFRKLKMCYLLFDLKYLCLEVP